MDKERKVSVSVIIPFYSHADWLEEALDSVLSQTLPAYEIIVINDGSKEDLSKLIEKYKKSVTFLKQENEGAANFSQGLDGTIRVDEDFCYVEFIANETDCSIVGTPLHYYRMPLIRYSTVYYAELSDKQDGKFRILTSLHLRGSEFVTTNQGT